MLTFVNPPKPTKRVELTQEQKVALFEKVQNQHNWKYPINKTVELEGENQINDLIHSITHFVGGTTDVEILDRSPNSITVRVQNQGYYINIGA